MIRALIVDDSATMRSLIAKKLRDAGGIEVVGEAADPIEARAAIKATNPDVITLDIEMPNMNGLDFLERLMRLRPLPVVMVSTLTAAGADATMEALELGAVDYACKPSTGGMHAFDDLAAKVKAAAGARVRASDGPRAMASPTPTAPAQGATGGFAGDGRVVAIGSSTGGVEALIAVLTRYPAGGPATVVTQHMPATFTKSLAARLDRLSQMTVTEASDGAPILPGHVYIAPGGDSHLEVAPGAGAGLRCRLRVSEPVNGHRPSVDVLFHSVAKLVGSKAVGVILTGMGRDGANGLLAMRQAGARTLGQDEASSVIYGMPKAAQEIGAVMAQAPLDRMTSEILKAAQARAGVHG